MKKLFTILLLSMMSIGIYAQKITVTSGSFVPLKGIKEFNVEFTYNNMIVGKMTEEEYVLKKVGDYNQKEAGRGDKWRESWFGDRTRRFEPKFIELFNKYMEEKGVTGGKNDAEYTIILNTDFTEPGFNVGVVRKNAAIDMTGKIVNNETGEEIVTFKIIDASANNFLGTDFDAGFRIQETYGKAGRQLAKYLIKKGGL